MIIYIYIYNYICAEREKEFGRHDDRNTIMRLLMATMMRVMKILIMMMGKYWRILTNEGESDDKDAEADADDVSMLTMKITW